MGSVTVPNKLQSQRGFTLIELSIVLVIIGLIVGGILVGGDMIKAAQIRATITQFERYDSAVNTFRTKFNGLPGDVPNALNFFAAGVVPTVANCAKYNAGNGVFDDCATGSGGVTLAGEPAAFWSHLYQSSLIAEAMTDTALIGSTAAVAAPGTIANAFPAAKLGGGNYIMVYTGSSTLVEPAMAGSNLYRIAGITSISAAGAPTFANDLTPLQAFAIDSKKDDGVPTTGVVQATNATQAASFNVVGDTATTGAGNCTTSATAYNATTTNGNTALCSLLIRPSF